MWVFFLFKNGDRKVCGCFFSSKMERERKTCSWEPSAQVFVTSGGGTKGRRWKRENMFQNIRLKLKVEIKVKVLSLLFKVDIYLINP